MTDTTNYTELQVLTAKDISFICCVSLRTAQNYMADIKRESNLSKVTYTHLRRYMQI